MAYAIAFAGDLVKMEDLPVFQRYHEHYAGDEHDGKISRLGWGEKGRGSATGLLGQRLFLDASANGTSRSAFLNSAGGARQIPRMVSHHLIAKNRKADCD
jgi:hypothetical protein